MKEIFVAVFAFLLIGVPTLLGAVMVVLTLLTVNDKEGFNG